MTILVLYPSQRPVAAPLWVSPSPTPLLKQSNVNHWMRQSFTKLCLCGAAMYLSDSQPVCYPYSLETQLRQLILNYGFTSSPKSL